MGSYENLTEQLQNIFDVTDDPHSTVVHADSANITPETNELNHACHFNRPMASSSEKVGHNYITYWTEASIGRGIRMNNLISYYLGFFFVAVNVKIFIFIHIVIYTL